MNVIIDLTHVASGPYFLVSGRNKPDKYRFVRVPGQQHIHRLTIPGKDAAVVLDDLALRTQQIDLPVAISFEMEESDLNADGVLTEKNEQIEELGRQLGATHELLRIAESKINAPKPNPVKMAGSKKVAPPGPTQEQLEMLSERDDMLIVLAPLAEGDEKPLDVLTRIVGMLKPSPTVEPPKPPPVDNDHVEAGAEPAAGKVVKPPRAKRAPAKKRRK